MVTKKRTKPTSSTKQAPPRPRKSPPNITVDVVRQTGAYGALGFRSVRVANHEGRSATPASGARHNEFDRPTLITQSREFMRDNGIYQGMISRAVGYIIANGFGLQIRSTNKKFNKDAERLWNNYWRRPEVRGLLSGSRLERMVCRELLVAGDTGILKVKGGLIQLIESEQIVGDGNNKDGIKKNAFGKPTKYFVARYGRGGRLDASKAKEIDPEDFLFLTCPDRPSSTRSTPPAQASFAMLHRINDVCDSEAIAWQLLARMGIAVTRAGGAASGWSESQPDPNKSGDQAEGDTTVRVTELDYAMMFHGEVGEEIKGIDRNIPGKDFPASLTMFLRLLGLPLGLPLEVILLDWTKSNYSQSRAVLEQAYQTFLGWQFLLEDFAYTPLCDWKIQQWRQEGLLNKTVEFKQDWIKPTFPWLDQLKEAQAQGMKLDRGLTTHTNVCKSLNLDRDAIVETRQKEIVEAIDLAKGIEKKTGEKVAWQYFAGLEAPKAAAVAKAEIEPEPPETEPNPDEPEEG